MFKFSGMRLARFLLQAIPAVLNSRSLGVLVAGVERSCLVTRAKEGKRSLFTLHHCKMFVLMATGSSALNLSTSDKDACVCMLDAAVPPNKKAIPSMSCDAGLATFAGGGSMASTDVGASCGEAASSDAHGSLAFFSVAFF